MNFFGSQITPEMFVPADVPDLQGLIAPRPLLVGVGAHDQCFRVESALSCYREVEKIDTPDRSGDQDSEVAEVGRAGQGAIGSDNAPGRSVASVDSLKRPEPVIPVEMARHCRFQPVTGFCIMRDRFSGLD